MKRIFSGAKSPEFPAPPKFFSGSSSGGESPGRRSRSSSFTKIFSGESSPKSPVMLPQETSTTGTLSPELVPIVTLLSAQTHRRYHEGVFLILHDLKNDGSSASRKWQEVYGVLIGTQLALWDAKELAGCDPEMRGPMLKQVASKPHYINFTDATLRSLDHSEAVITDSKKKIENALVVSTTLKNRYFLQFSDKDSFAHWNAAIRLSLFEFTSLQEAYTGAFLSSRGAKLGDIKIILSSSKFDYEDWVSVRFGTGMPWKRCYAVISQSTSKKQPFGKIKFYENEKKNKKSNAMATVVSAKAIYAVYPSFPLLIDTSTIIKLEGEISLEKKDSPQETNVFIMPEKHQAVPGYDTIIRFLIPAMNAFKLYGRPKRLIANKEDQNSLLYALPTLPHVHYLKVGDLLPLANSASSLQWSAYDWRDHIRDILQKKIPHGYSGCGSSAGVTGALSSPVIGSAELFESSGTISSPTFLPKYNRPMNASSLTFLSNNSGSQSTLASGSPLGKPSFKLSPSSTTEKQSVQNSTGPSDYNRSSREIPESFTYSHGSPEKSLSGPLKVDIRESNFDRLAVATSKNKKPNPVEKYSNSSDLSALYDKYSASPFGSSPARGSSPISQTIQVTEKQTSSTSDIPASPYAQYVGSSAGKTFEISHVRDSASSSKSHTNDSFDDRYFNRDENYNQSQDDDLNPLDEFNELAKTISEIGTEDKTSASRYKSHDAIESDFNFDASGGAGFGYERATDEDEENVFDPDYVEQNQMLETDSMLNVSDELSDHSQTSSANAAPNTTRDIKDPRSYKQNPIISNSGESSIPHSIPINNLKNLSQPAQNFKQRDYSNESVNSTNYGRAMPNAVRDQAQNTMPYSTRQLNTNTSPNIAGKSPANSPQYQQFPQNRKGLQHARPAPSPYNHYTGQQQPHVYHNQYQTQQQYQSQNGNIPQAAHPSSKPYPSAQRYPAQQHAPQPPFPQSGRPYNRPKNGPYPPQPMNSMGFAHQYVGGNSVPQSGPFPPVKPMSNTKQRPPPNQGFSQFMPSATENPYSR